MISRLRSRMVALEGKLAAPAGEQKPSFPNGCWKNGNGEVWSSIVILPRLMSAVRKLQMPTE